MTLTNADLIKAENNTDGFADTPGNTKYTPKSASTRLLDAAADIWAKYNEHPFVKGIEDGTLDHEKFRYYIIQDYLYLEDYARVFAIGAAKARSTATMKLFSDYIQAITGEMDIHEGYMGKLAITDDELAASSRALDNLSYTSYMLRVAYEESEVEILAAVLSCAVSYEVIAKKIIENRPESANDSFYGDWISGYASDDYAAENKVLVEMFDSLTADCSESELKHLEEIFIACSRYELAFWEMGWRMCD